jgi:hypothetical protein
MFEMRTGVTTEPTKNYTYCLLYQYRVGGDAAVFFFDVTYNPWSLFSTFILQTYLDNG